MHESSNNKAAQTREAILRAFNELVLQPGSETIRAADVIHHADVGRSTFYDHYTGMDDVRRRALSHPLGLLADVLVERADQSTLVDLLDHFHENRHRAHSMLATTAMRDAVSTLLDELIAERLPAEPALPHGPIQRRQLADATMSAIRLWLTDDAGNTRRDDLAEAMLSTARLFLAYWRADPTD